MDDVVDPSTLLRRSCRLINHQGALAIERGLSGTVARRFPKGRVNFAPSDELNKAMVCDTDCRENGADSTYGTSLLLQSALKLSNYPQRLLAVKLLLGEPVGFMLVNGKKAPYYDQVEMQFFKFKDLAKSWSTWVLGAVTVPCS